MKDYHLHDHCWQEKNPPCGQKIKHFECCLCKKEHPEIEAERQKREEAVREERERIIELLQDFPKEAFIRHLNGDPMMTKPDVIRQALTPTPLTNEIDV